MGEMGEQLVVVGVDGSTASYAALRWAYCRAHRCAGACGALLGAGVGEGAGSGGHR